MGTIARLKARRKQIADEMALSPEGRRRDEIPRLAHKHNVSLTTVISACREHQVKIPRAKRS